MSECIYKTKESVLTRAREAIGIPFSNIDTTGRISTGKGAIGNVLEESWFGYKINNESAPDFPEAGVELKATPYIKTRKGIRAKERLVCNIIDYMKEYTNVFRTSSFWTKCNTILIMSYEHKENVLKENFFIDKAVLFDFPIEDLIIIEQDWEKIINKVNAGKAHEISEGDTLYLGACTKGANARSVREQPFSSIPAKQRAYSLKQSYMTYVLNTYIFKNKASENIIKNPKDLKTLGFEPYIRNKIRPFVGKSQQELKRLLGIDSNAKHLSEIIVSRILDVANVEESAEFKKANIKLKTVRLEANGVSIEQSMSFPAFSFIDVANGTWEESDEYLYFVEQKYMFAVFKKDNQYISSIRTKAELIAHCANEENIKIFNQQHLFFQGIYFWQLPESDIDEVQRVWERTAHILNKGVELNKVARGNVYIMQNSLPKISESNVAHVRPHARVSAYGPYHPNANQLPDGRWMTKQSFWFNSSYLEEQIQKLIADED